MKKRKIFLCRLLMMVLVLGEIGAAFPVQAFDAEEKEAMSVATEEDEEEIEAGEAERATEEVIFELTYGQTEARKAAASVNELRKQKNLEELTYDYGLETIAMERAAEVAVCYGAGRPNGSMFDSILPAEVTAGAFGEQIFLGNGTAEEAVGNWLSRGNNLFSESFKNIAIGHIVVDGQDYWVIEQTGVLIQKDPTEANDKKDQEVTVDVATDKILDLKATPEKAENSRIYIDREKTTVLPAFTVGLETKNHKPSDRALPLKNYSLTWSLDDTTLAKIENNTITGLKDRGDTVLKATIQGCGKSRSVSYSIHTVVHPTGITVAPKEAVLEPDEELALQYIIEPEDCDNRNVIFRPDPSNPGVTVTQDGVIKATGTGTAKISVETEDGGLKDYCTVTINSGSTLEVSQEDGVYGMPLAAPVYEKPEAGGTETFSYSGVCTKDNTEYGPTETAPALPGSYTVCVTYETGVGIYSGSADFVIRKANHEDIERNCQGTAGVEGNLELKQMIEEGASLGEPVVIYGNNVLAGNPSVKGTVFGFRVKETAKYIYAVVRIPVTGAYNYNDYFIQYNIKGGSYRDAEGNILLNGEEVSSLKEAFGRMNDANTEYVLHIGIDITGEKNITIPKTAGSVIICGNGHTLEIMGTKFTANAPLTLENIRIKAVNKQYSAAKFTLYAKKDLEINADTIIEAASVAVKSKGRTILRGELEAKTATFNSLSLEARSVIKVLPGSNISINGLFKGNGGKIELADGFTKPINIKGGVEGTISFIGEKQADGTQILKCSSKKIDAGTLRKAFDVSGITENTIDTYLYYFSSGKAMIFGEAINYNGKKYGVWKDAVAAMNADLKSLPKSMREFKNFVIELDGDVNMKGSFKLPSKGYYYLIIEAKGHTVTFIGNIKLTGNTIFNAMSFDKVRKNGKEDTSDIQIYERGYTFRRNYYDYENLLNDV